MPVHFKSHGDIITSGVVPPEVMSMNLKRERQRLLWWTTIFGVLLFAAAFGLERIMPEVDSLAVGCGASYSALNIWMLGYPVASVLRVSQSNGIILAAIGAKLVLFFVLVAILSTCSEEFFWSALAGVFVFVPASLCVVYSTP